VAAYSRAIGSPYWPPESQAQRLARKFDEEHVRAEVKRRLGEGYSRALILGSYGRFEPEKEARSKLINALQKLGIRVVNSKTS
jgi:cytosine/adenosine deaminase-related metal-dependent hydrolase